jgi:diguanylate cyclase (GGDEF)-like protein
MRTESHDADPFAVSFRMRTLKTGVWPTFIVIVYCTIYYARTWGEPHRPLLLGLLSVAAGSSIVVALLPMERIVRGAWREPFFITWSGTLIVLVTVTASLDGGVHSPLTALFFLPLVYASLSYPFAAMMVVGVMDLGGYVLLSVLTKVQDDGHAFVFSGALVTATVICAWQARNHAKHRADLVIASRTDPLTQCLNRRGFEDRLKSSLALGREVTLLVFDLDGFKRVNDEHGHAAGDELLRWVAGVLRATLRAEDDVGRLGGDEFAAIVVGGDPLFVMRRVVAALGERVPASAGVAVFPHDGDTPGRLHAVADASMYADKRRRGTPV